MTELALLSDLAPLAAARLPALPPGLEEQARALVRAAKAPATLRAYRSDWEHFRLWCDGCGLPALPASPETVALYLAALSQTHRPATITRRLTAITKNHAVAGLSSPATMAHAAVAETLQGIRRTLGVAQPGKAPLVTADLHKVLAHLAPGLAGLRDRALLLVGYAGALRRSEIAALNVEDVAWEDAGAALTLRRSKTDQTGQGRRVALPRGAHPETCPARALRAWLDAARITEGPLFRAVGTHGGVRGYGLHADSVGAIVKRAAARAGYPAPEFAGHSLRAGFCTQAARGGATAFDIMRQTGHRSVATVSRYIREAELFRDSPASKLGL